MFKLICNPNLAKLDRMHKNRYHPRKDLCRLLQKDPLGSDEERVPTNLVVTNGGKFQLWQDGKKLGDIHLDTMEIVLAIWRENLDAHKSENDTFKNPMRHPITHEKIKEFSKDAVGFLRQARTNPLDKKQEAVEAAGKQGEEKPLFQWPDDVIANAK